MFVENEVLLAAAENCRKNGSSLHIMGLLSDGGVHSHNTHLYALLELAKREGLKKVHVHCFLDGRDTPPTSAKGYVAELEEKGISCEPVRTDTFTGEKMTFFRDPDGLPIEIHE